MPRKKKLDFIPLSKLPLGLAKETILRTMNNYRCPKCGNKNIVLKRYDDEYLFLFCENCRKENIQTIIYQ